MAARESEAKKESKNHGNGAYQIALASCIIIILLMSVMFYWTYQVQTNQIGSLLTQITVQNNHVDSLLTQVAGQSGQIDSLRTQVASQSSQIDSLRVLVAGQTNQIDSLRTQVVALTPDFTLGGCTPNNGVVLQGGTLQTSLSISSSGRLSKQVSLGLTGAPSGVTCSFSPQSGVPPFTTSIAITVSGNVPTAAYSLAAIAATGNVSQTATYTLVVLSSKIAVSGSLLLTKPNTHSISIRFVSVETEQIYTTNTFADTFTIELPNLQHYRVTVSWASLFGQSGTFDAEMLTVDIGAGRTTMSEDFIGD